MKRSFALILVFLVSSFGVQAQDATPEPLCAPADYQSFSARLLPLVQNLTDPTADSQAALESIHAASVAMLSKCAGLSFSSQVNGVQPLIGPVDIPAGVYRATLTTRGYAALDVNALSGDCGAGTGDYFETNVFNLSDGQATTGAGAVFTSKGCQALIQLSNVSAPPWTLTFEKLR